MPLRCPPPGPSVVARLPRFALAGVTLWRIFVRRRGQPWFFASVPEDGPQAGGRFDLSRPHGACYLATSRIAAALEALQEFGEGLLPDVALGTRALARVRAPATAPAAARLTAASARGIGATAALWAREDRSCTQAWGDTLYRAGWRAAYHGIAHDPAGRLRAVTLFDQAGAHPPYDDPDWAVEIEKLDTPEIRSALARFGIEVTRSDPELPLVALEDSGLLEGGDP